MRSGDGGRGRNHPCHSHRAHTPGSPGAKDHPSLTREQNPRSARHREFRRSRRTTARNSQTLGRRHRAHRIHRHVHWIDPISIPESLRRLCLPCPSVALCLSWPEVLAAASLAPRSRPQNAQRSTDTLIESIRSRFLNPFVFCVFCVRLWPCVFRGPRFLRRLLRRHVQGQRTHRDPQTPSLNRFDRDS